MSVHAFSVVVAVICLLSFTSSYALHIVRCNLSDSEHAANDISSKTHTKHCKFIVE